MIQNPHTYFPDFGSGYHVLSQSGWCWFQICGQPVVHPGFGQFAVRAGKSWRVGGL